MTARYRLRPTLQLGRDASGRWLVRDRQLRRTLRLGEVDRRLAELLARPRGTTAEDAARLLDLSGAEIAQRLTGLARLYLLSGPRGRRRVELQDEQERWHRGERPAPADASLHWPSGLDPPQHGCVATGGCCSASFLGPMTAADRVRVSGLTMGERSKVAAGAQALEHLTFEGVEYVGMARLAGRCVAQGPDLLCDIHASHGMAAKPVPCRQFPLRFHRSPRGVHVSLLLACAGYDRARGAALPWPERADEVRGLLAEGASVPAMTLPVTWSAGLPMALQTWWELSAALLRLFETHADDPRAGLAAVLDRFEGHLQVEERAHREGPAVRWRGATEGLAAALRDPFALACFDPGALAAQRLELVERAAAIAAKSPADAARLRLLADAVGALRIGHASAPRGALVMDAEARRHLSDVVKNDLPVQVALGQVDAGLATLARRLLLCDVLACHLAHSEGAARVAAQHTTAALACISRSEPDVAVLGVVRT